MRPISQAQPCDSAQRAHTGFTLVETLLALTLLALLIAVTASTLSVTLRTEQSLTLLDESWRIAHSLQAERYLTGQSSNTSRRYAERWTIEAASFLTGEATNPVAWTVWEIRANERVSALARLAFQE